MRSILVVRAIEDRGIADRLASDFRKRGYSVHESEPGPELSIPSELSATGAPALVVLLPHAPVEEDARGRMDAYLRQTLDASLHPIVVAPAGARLPDWAHGDGVRAIVRTSAAGLDYDRVFEGLFRALLAPLPDWLDVVVRPSLIEAPTGVAWWAGELGVADEYFGHLVRIGTDRSNVVITGLSQPHHLHAGGRRLLVANRAAHEVVVAEIRGALVTDIRAIDRAGGMRLNRPLGVHQSHGRTVIADTENHRVLISEDDVWKPRARWVQAESPPALRNPCGVHFDGNRIWVADTFNHRIVVFDHGGRYVGEAGQYGWEPVRFSQPVAIVRWGSSVLVSDEKPKRIQIFRIGSPDYSGSGITPEGSFVIMGEARFGGPWIRSPFALSVNRENRLAVTDRAQRCIWLIDLEGAIGGAGGAPEGP